MSEMIVSYLSEFSSVYFFNQTAAILILTVFGFLVNTRLLKGKNCLMGVLLSFPVGLSVYSLVSFAMLIAGIPFTRPYATGICTVIAVICITGLRDKDYLGGLGKKRILTYSITLLFIVMLSVSGFIPVSVSNDSLYYYSMYPRALVRYGYLRPQFDVFLTDVGQGSAIINTLPFMYGFNESFGIQIFLGINTLLIAVRALYSKASDELSGRKALIVTVLLTALLVCTQPYLIMSSWLMSNGYFMCFLFIVIYTVSCIGEGTLKEEGSQDAGNRTGMLVIASLLFTQMSTLRMEGVMVSLMLVLCFCMLDFKNTELFPAFLLPMSVFALCYALRVFTTLHVDAPYTFLTPKKAMIEFAALAAASVYILFIRGRKIDVIGRRIKTVLPVILILANGVLFTMNKTLYLQNALSFVMNISHRSGWGLFPMCLIAGYMLVFIVGFKGENGRMSMTFFDLCFVCYLLAAFAVCFAREDALRESIGDSGNRVLMQGTLLAFMALADHLVMIVDPDMK